MPRRTLRRQPIIAKPVDVPKGTVYVIAEECKGCDLCIDFCPRGVLAQSPQTNAKGHHYPIVVKEGECANCQMCYLICSEFAIFSTLALDTLHAVETETGSDGAKGPEGAEGRFDIPSDPSAPAVASDPRLRRSVL